MTFNVRFKLFDLGFQLFYVIFGGVRRGVIHRLPY